MSSNKPIKIFWDIVIIHRVKLFLELVTIATSVWFNSNHESIASFKATILIHQNFASARLDKESITLKNPSKYYIYFIN